MDRRAGINRPSAYKKRRRREEEFGSHNSTSPFFLTIVNLDTNHLNFIKYFIQSQPNINI